MKLSSTLLVALGLCFASTATLQAQDPMATLIDQWESAFNSGDYAAAAAYYTTDAIRFPPGAEPLKGRDAIAAEMSNYSDLMIELELLGTKASGDIISAWGTYALFAREGEGEGPVQAGPWMNVAVQGTDGAWLIYRDIWNLGMEP